MALVTVRKASELTGKSIPTLYRHIKQGRLSRRSDELIDTAELIRAYGELRLNDYQGKAQIVSSDSHDIAWYRHQIELLQAQLLSQREEFLQREKNFMLLLEHMPEGKSSKKVKGGKKAKKERSLLDRLGELLNNRG
jgi:hypothetical protein